ncbi:GspH/FimT family pseudopilin [Pleionea mediterranea]|uniref:Type II secretion system protein H n=1 Tax=Pleionea mediterranea TaxID=523701 RepID=A0A316FQH2_9GAMM|nr:GspH/FimT family pseudopilin [Pleionea mediterranea]PWK50914.1 type IV fimbrial biogenesis protein FimU [Pleionea mediterranea]
MRNQGFTLIELLVTVSMVAILAAFAIPAYQSTIQRNQLTSCSNKVASAVQFAKSEAISSKQTIVVQILSGDNLQYRVGTDADENDAVENDDLLQALECSGEGISLNVTDSVTHIAFGPTGFRSDGQGIINFLTCNEVGAGKVFTVSNGGSVSNHDAASGSC